jgi:glycosyltransferase involved in cell wall biosynthesis
MAFRLPVISSRVGAIPEVIDDGVTGVLVHPGDVPALSSAMGRPVADRSRAHRMGEAARAVFLARFTPERFRAEAGRIYREAIESRCAGS